MKMTLPILFLSFFAICSSTLNSYSSQLQDESYILQTAKFSTNENSYNISQDFEVREFLNGKIMRISGLTTSGNFFYAYHKMIDEEMLIFGKVLVNDQFVPIIQKLPMPVEQKIESPIQLMTIINYPQTVYSEQNYNVVSRIYDATQNPNENINQNWGYLSGIDVKVTITDSENNVLSTFEGKTSSTGYYIGTFYFQENSVPSGTYILTVQSGDGIMRDIQKFEIFVHAKHFE